MNEIIIRKYRPGDETAIKEITYQTGFKGEDLTGKDFFDDKHLHYLIFNYYYQRYEPEHYYVAEEKTTGNVIGYICGTPNTDHQETSFKKNIHWRILVRAFTYTIWRSPKTFVNLLMMSKIRTSIDPSEFTEIISAYPAHLHINLLPEYQRLGTGTRLIQRFENHLHGLDVRGVHLQTSSYNSKAVPFYQKLGFMLVSEVPMEHFKFNDIKLLTFAKTINNNH